MVENGTGKHIAIVLFPEVEELDAVGPWEVLSFWTHGYPEDGYTVSCVSRDGAPVTCAKGLTIHPHHSFTDVPPVDVLIFPGGRGARKMLDDDTHLDWVRRQRKTTPIMASVCTGSLVYAAAGLLENRPATTHWASLDRLAELDSTIDVRRDERFVDDGDVVTSAGVSAGIDMALRLIVRLAGTNRARDVRRGIQYDPEPPA
ncbi:DJ-1/PfpI family protein [Phytoactinopolyspora mesophila]|uniref:DJ-1/PfpI family protein n=1 Tax=Phytoactinopolyspora mesophila TaxID=2650750 RepID=A0A7K3LYZ0_9ACTN|nr:DJ-1/PfpI family protein [Phytoactinopolyspora mesophila]NDL56037.1 DJ-1/PfpI family protein [Phytoactinopolyspora mesophila]